MSENKADPLREALAAFTNFIDEPQQYEHLRMVRIQTARAAPQPAAPLGGRDEIARMIRKALVENWRDDYDGRQWNEDVLLTGCRKVGGGMGYQKPEEAAQRLTLDAADAILAAIPQESGYTAALENLREAWTALAMIRETIETLGPIGAVKASEHLDGPTFMHEAEALVAGIRALGGKETGR